MQNLQNQLLLYITSFTIYVITSLKKYPQILYAIKLTIIDVKADPKTRFEGTIYATLFIFTLFQILLPPWTAGPTFIVLRLTKRSRCVEGLIVLTFDRAPSRAALEGPPSRRIICTPDFIRSPFPPRQMPSPRERVPPLTPIYTPIKGAKIGKEDNINVLNFKFSIFSKI